MRARSRTKSAATNADTPATTRPRARVGLGLLAACLLLPTLVVGGCGDDAREEAVLSCAASLRRVMPDLLEAYAASGGAGRFRATYAGSGTLRHQVEAGAPVGGVILASAEDVDRLVDKGFVDAGSRAVLARNALVLVGADSFDAASFRTLADLPAGGRIAMGDPRSVPVGRHAKAALESLGVWEKIEARVVFAGDVAGVTAYVRRGEAAVGIVYATEAADIPALHVMDRAGGDWAPRPVIVGGACAASEHAEVVKGLLRYLASAPAAQVWDRHGFLRP